MAINWSESVNTKTYGLDTGYGENTEVIEMKSGKKRVYLKNSSPKKTHAFMLKMSDRGENSEYKHFLNWFETIAQSGTESFLFPDLITHTGLKEYQFSESPTATGQAEKEVTISVREV